MIPKSGSRFSEKIMLKQELDQAAGHLRQGREPFARRALGLGR
jgi:hypothetical protein